MRSVRKRKNFFTQSHNTKVVQKPTTHPTTGGGCRATQMKFTMQKESLLVNWAQTAASSCPVTNSTQRATARVLTVCEEQAPPQHMMMMRAVWLLAAARGCYGGARAVLVLCRTVIDAYPPSSSTHLISSSSSSSSSHLSHVWICGQQQQQRRRCW